jgi:hypothetical protein
VAWDANISTNVNVVQVSDSNNTVFEDLAAFGTGRKSISTSQGGNNTTCRRCWARWEGSTHTSPKLVFEVVYNSTGFRCENCIGSVTGQSMPESYTDSNGNNQAGFFITNTGGYFFFGANGSRDPEECQNVQLLGSLFYVGAMDNWGSMGRVVQRANPGANCWELRHVFVLVDPNNSRFNGPKAFELTTSVSGTSNLIARNLTSVIGNGGNSFGAQWAIASNASGASLAAVPNPWTTTGAGANLCRKWGSNDPLWPWPMNARISEATASAGSYTGPCPGCSGGRLARTATNVTATVESILGQIPPMCKR